MSKFEITHTCGHQVTHQIYGTNVRGERDSKAARLADQPCRDCAYAAKNADRAAAVVHAAEATADLPALTGSAKQIAWATTIRATAIAAARDLVATVDNPDKIVTDAIAALEGQAEAAWWIDNRHSEADGYGWLRNVAGA